MNVLITCYFSTKVDPMKGSTKRQTTSGHVKSNNFKLISKYYNSVKDNDLNCIIFYDNLSNTFLKKYQTDKIKFIKWDISQYPQTSINDIRFLVYKTYLTDQIKAGQIYDKICITDAFDVVIIQNPFKVITEQDHLYVCQERAKTGLLTLSNSEWINSRYELAFGTELTDDAELTSYLDAPPVNAGVLGGYTSSIMNLLTKMETYFDIARKDINSNMAVTNRAAFTIFGSKIKYGEPFCTEFKKSQTGRKDCCIRHK